MRIWSSFGCLALLRTQVGCSAWCPAGMLRIKLFGCHQLGLSILNWLMQAVHMLFLIPVFRDHIALIPMELCRAGFIVGAASSRHVSFVFWSKYGCNLQSRRRDSAKIASKILDNGARHATNGSIL
uniref:Putative secreted protein n=1 Tax=Ixodes ricinus TaxID=34613 RepID=A0A6B0UQ32_IXORI